MDWQTVRGEDGEQARVSDRLAEFGEELLALWRVVIALREPGERVSVPPLGAEAERLAAELLARQEKSRATDEGEADIRLGGKSESDALSAAAEFGRSVDTAAEESGILRRVRGVGGEEEEAERGERIAELGVAAMTDMAVRGRGNVASNMASFESGISGRVSGRGDRTDSGDVDAASLGGMLSSGAVLEEAARSYWNVGAVGGLSGGAGRTAVGGTGGAVVGGSVYGVRGGFGDGNESAELSERVLEQICERVAERLSESIEVYLQTAAMRG